MFEVKGKYTTAKIMIDDIESQCYDQIAIMVSHPAFTNPVSIMPDTHSGKGSVVGFTMPMSDKITPNVIGVDIGCGMRSTKLDITKYDIDLKIVDKKIQSIIPTGVGIHDEFQVKPTDMDKVYNKSTIIASRFIAKYNTIFGTKYKSITFNEDYLNNKIKEIGVDVLRAKNSIGTLGGGNHFIEIGESNVDGKLWLTIHSGSRKYGEMVCKLHQNKAKKSLDNKRKVEFTNALEELKKKFSGKKLEDQIKALRKELGLNFDINISGMEYLEGQGAIDYIMDMIFAQQYASLNRQVMTELILKGVFKGVKVLDMIESIHNYIDFDDMIIRKGAISSRVGIKSVIPFNMEDGLLITEGKSNPEWNHSAPHGAGRVMSRSEAKKVLSLDDMKRGMEDAGVYSTSLNKHTLDEAKGAYKDSKIIEDAIEPTASIVDRVNPIINIKDSSTSMTWKERRSLSKDKKERSKKKDEANFKRMKSKYK